MSVQQKNLLGEEMPPPVITFVLVVTADDDGFHVKPVPVHGHADMSFFETCAQIAEDTLDEEFSE